MFDIYFSDLNEECQKQLLQSNNARSAREMNWDMFPVTSIETLADRVSIKTVEVPIFLADFALSAQEEILKQMGVLGLEELLKINEMKATITYTVADRKGD